MMNLMNNLLYFNDNNKSLMYGQNRVMHQEFIYVNLEYINIIDLIVHD